MFPFGIGPLALCFFFYRYPGHCRPHRAPYDPLLLPLDSVATGGCRNRGQSEGPCLGHFLAYPSLVSYENPLAKPLAPQSLLSSSTFLIHLALGFGLETALLDLCAYPHIITASSALRPRLSAALSVVLVTGYSRVLFGPYRPHE